MSAQEFWQQVYIAAIRGGYGYDGARITADEAVKEFVARVNRGEL